MEVSQELCDWGILPVVAILREETGLVVPEFGKLLQKIDTREWKADRHDKIYLRDWRAPAHSSSFDFGLQLSL